MLALRLQRFLLLDIRDVSVAVMIGIMEFRERVVMRRTLYPGVKYPDLFLLRDIVIHNHSLAADNRHLPDFARIQPTAVDDGRAIFGKSQTHRGHVFDSRRDMRAAAAVHADGKLLQ